MSVRYLYNTSGKYVAFVQGNNIFSPEAEWLGFIRNGNEVFKKTGQFWGFLLEDDRVAANAQMTRLNVFPPFAPFKPFTPFKPFARMAKFPLPSPWVDVFEPGAATKVRSLTGGANPLRYSRVGRGASSTLLDESDELLSLEGSRIVASDGTPLGLISTNKYAADSISNPYGTYGNRYSPESILNRYGTYGGDYSIHSPFNAYATSPPQIIRSQAPALYLTKNPYLRPRIDPTALLSAFALER